MYYAMQVLQADKCKCVHITYSIYMHTYIHIHTLYCIYVDWKHLPYIHPFVIDQLEVSDRILKRAAGKSSSHTYIHTYLLTYLFIYPNIFLPSYIETYICKCLYLYPHIHSHIHTYTCTYPYTYIQTYIHTPGSKAVAVLLFITSAALRNALSMYVWPSPRKLYAWESHHYWKYCSMDTYIHLAMTWKRMCG
jgi:hypothetical protein